MWSGGAYGQGEEYAFSQPPAQTMVAVAAELRALSGQTTDLPPSVGLATSPMGPTTSLDEGTASMGYGRSAANGSIAHDSELDLSASESISMLTADELTENEAILRSGAMTPGTGFHSKTNSGAHVVESLSTALTALAGNQSAIQSRAASHGGTPLMSAAETSDPDAVLRSVYNVPSFGVGPSRTAEVYRQGLIAAHLVDSESEYDSTAARRIDSASDTLKKTARELSAAQDFAVMRMPSTGPSSALNSEKEYEDKLVRVRFVSLAEVAAGSTTDGEREALEYGPQTRGLLNPTTDEERDNIAAGGTTHGESLEYGPQTRGLLNPTTDEERDGVKLDYETHLPLVESRDDDDRKSKNYQHPLVQDEAQFVILSQLPFVAVDSSGDSSKDSAVSVEEEDYVAVATMPLASAQNAIGEIRRRGTANVRYLGLCMLILWTGYNTVQGLIVSWNPRLGPIVMATYYVAYVCSSFAVGAIMQRFTAIGTLRVTWVFFVLFISSLVVPVEVIVIIATALVGIAGAPMWTAIAMYVGKNSDSTTIARNNGAFAGIQQNNFIISSLASALLLSFTSLEARHVFGGAAVLALIAVVLSKFLKTPSFLAPETALSIDTYNQEVVMLQVAPPLIEEYRGDHTMEHAVQPEGEEALFASDGGLTPDKMATPARVTDVDKKESFLTVVRRECWVLFTLHRHKRVITMIPFWSFTGLLYGLAFGPLPTLLEINFVGFGLAMFGVGSVSSSLFFGYLAGRGMISSRTSVFVGSASQMVCLGLSFYASSIDESDKVLSDVIVFVAYFFGGFADGGLHPNLLALVPASCPDNRAAGFALFRVYQSLALALGNICLTLGWRTTELAILGAIWLAVSLLCMIANGPLVIPD